MRKMRQGIAWLLVLAALFSLTGCNRGTKGADDAEAPGKDNSNAQQKLYASRFTYDVGALNDICIDGDGYLLATGGGIRRLDGQFTLTAEKVSGREALTMTAEDGVPVFVAYTGAGAGVYRGKTLQFEFAPMTVHDYTGQIVIRDGDVWFCDGIGIVTRNGVPLELPRQPGTEWLAKALLQTEDGLFAVLSEYQDGASSLDASSVRLVPVDGKTKSLSKNEGLLLPEELFAPSAVCSPETGCLVANNELWRKEGDGFSLVADLSKYGVSPFLLRRVLLTEDGDILCLEKDVLTVLSAVPPEQDSVVPGEMPAQQEEPKTLNMACLWCDPSYLIDLISYINLSETGYLITVKNFRDPEKLNQAILAGEVDIIATGDMPLIRNYSKRGMLQPVDTLLPELFSSDLLYQNTIDALKTDGKLYAVPVELWPHVCEMPKKYEVDPDSIKSVSDLVELLEEKERLCFEYGVKQYVLQNDWLPWTINQWYDSETGTVNFDCPEFIDVLEFCDRYFLTNEEFEASEAASVMGGIEPRFLICGAGKSFSIQDFRRQVPYTLPFKGMSTVAMEVDCGLAFVNRADPEAVKFIVETMLTDEGWIAQMQKVNKNNYFALDNYYFLNREWTEAELERQKERILLFTPENAQKAIQDGTVTTAELFAESHQIFYYDRELFKIILEEAEVYFNGDITAAEAARRIQNRVEIYLSERS